MRKFSTAATAATGAVLALTGLGAANATGPETDTMETVRSNVTEGMASMRSALATRSVVDTESITVDTTPSVADSTGVVAQLRSDPTAKPDLASDSAPGLEGAGTVHRRSGGIMDSCSGTKLESENLVNDYGTTVGRVELWYSSVHGGRNCVITYNYVDGGATYTDASLWVDDNGDGEEDRWRYDEGQYYSYAGASYLDNTDGRCVAIFAEVSGGDPSTSQDDATHFHDWYHCG